MKIRILALIMGFLSAVGGWCGENPQPVKPFVGKFYQGVGDPEYLQLLDIARRMFTPDAEYQNVSMLYTPIWNGLVEGPTWNAWWIQNSYGPTYCAMPFYPEPYITFLKNSHDLWFSQMGDGMRRGANDWIAPDGCLCDAASPGWIVYKQGDGRINIHDWGMEFTAAGLLMQAELLLIRRDENEIQHYLPMLERCAEFIESRRDPKNNLFWVGPAGNLLAPSYAGYRKPDGTYDKAYLAGLSITYIAALDRLMEVEKLAGFPENAKKYSERQQHARQGLAAITTDEGYFIKSLDPDGAKHGVFGAEKYGYFETSPNHDAIAFRVVDDSQAKKIYAKIAAIPGLRPHDFILPNCPSLDDMYEKPEGLWEFGRWVNGGHWSTCEARMIMAYYRLGKYEDARRSMKQLLTFARRFRMDNPLTNFGSDVYQPNEPINLCYDSFGPPAAMIRGLFEYLYSADGLKLIPHIPPGITYLKQTFPIHFGKKKVFISINGSGEIANAAVNEKPWNHFTKADIFLPYEETPEVTRLDITLQNAQPVPALEEKEGFEDFSDKTTQRFFNFHTLLNRLGFQNSYELAHCELILAEYRVMKERQSLFASGKLQPLADKKSQAAADKVYQDSADKLVEGLKKVIASYDGEDNPQKKRIVQLWNDSEKYTRAEILKRIADGVYSQK